MILLRVEMFVSVPLSVYEVDLTVIQTVYIPLLLRRTATNIDALHRFIKNGGGSPDGSGGMIPSAAPPFAMTRWVAQTRQNYVSVTPYNHTGTSIHGFQGTHQPVIWMGESGQATMAPGAGEVKSVFERCGVSFKRTNEIATASYYSVILDALEGGAIHAEQFASTHIAPYHT